MNKNFNHKRTKLYQFIWTVVSGLGILFASGCSQLPNTQDRGLRLIQEGNIEEAINYYDKVIESNPDQPSFYYNRGLAWHMREDFERALEDYSKAIQLDSEFISAKTLKEHWKTIPKLSNSIVSLSVLISIEV